MHSCAGWRKQRESGALSRVVSGQSQLVRDVPSVVGLELRLAFVIPPETAARQKQNIHS